MISSSEVIRSSAFKTFGKMCLKSSDSAMLQTVVQSILKQLTTGNYIVLL